MAKSNVRISFTGDDSDLKRTTRSAESDIARLNKAGVKAFGGLAKGAAIAGVGVAAFSVKLGTDAVKAAIESEKSTARLQAQMKALGLSYEQHAKTIDTVIQKQSQLAGLDDEELQDSFTNLVRTTKDVNKALELNAIVADVARAKQISVQAASLLVQKAQMGQVGALKRQGIEVQKVTAAQDALKASKEKYTKAEMDAAKAADLAATKQGLVGQLQRTFAGSAEKYGKTTAGAIDRAKVSMENLQETAGAVLAPLVAKIADAGNRALTAVQAHWPEIQRVIGRVFDRVRVAWDRYGRPVFDALVTLGRKLVDQVREHWGSIKATIGGTLRGIAEVVRTVVAVISAVWARFGDDILTIVRTVFGIVYRTVKTTLENIRDVFRIIGALIRGDWGKAWELLKGIVGRTLGAMWDNVRGSVKIATTVFKALGGAMYDGLKAGLSGIGGLVIRLVKAPINAIIDKVNRVKVGPLDPIPDIPRLASGGRVEGAYGAGDRVPVVLAGNEVVLNPLQQAMVGAGRIARALQATNAPVIRAGMRLGGGGEFGALVVNAGRADDGFTPKPFKAPAPVVVPPLKLPSFDAPDAPNIPGFDPPARRRGENAASYYARVGAARIEYDKRVAEKKAAAARRETEARQRHNERVAELKAEHAAKVKAAEKTNAQRLAAAKADYARDVARDREAYIANRRAQLEQQAKGAAGALDRSGELAGRQAGRNERARDRSSEDMSTPQGVARRRAELDAAIGEKQRAVNNKRALAASWRAAAAKARAAGFPGLAAEYERNAQAADQDALDLRQDIADLQAEKAKAVLQPATPADTSSGDASLPDLGGDIPAGIGDISGGLAAPVYDPVPDLNAQLDRERLRTYVAQRAAALSGAFVGALGLTPRAGSGSNITVQSLFPPPAEYIAQLAQYAAQGFGQQGFVQASTANLGV